MRRIIITLFSILLCPFSAIAQYSQEQACDKLLELTKMFRGAEPFSCNAIAEIKYKSTSVPIRDTSRLIYKNGSTYYKSRLVERVEASLGELTVNHELQTVSLYLSDSIREVAMKEINAKPNTEAEAMLEENVDGKDLTQFRDFLVKDCNAKWEAKDGFDEITFTPKSPEHSVFLSMKIRFSDKQVRYYEYAVRDIYATDYYGKSKFRVVKTIYSNFGYDNVADIPARLSDFLEWKGWTIKLKKYTNYQLSVL